jgi:L-ascorbate metabolism protein UlaG (beta-lactamase superfamily)
MTLLKRAEKRIGKYQNPIPTQMASVAMFFKMMPLYLKSKAEVVPKRHLGPFTTDAGLYGAAPASGLRVTWFGHSASLLEIDGFRVLIDPVWDQRASPFQFMGPKRFFQPTLELSDMPKVDVILVSHDHYDHLGAGTIRRLAGLSEARWVTSLGVARRLRRLGVAADKITELDWTESVSVGGLKLTAWPARHFSGRGIRDRFKTLWSSFVLEGPQHRVFYGADSGWWEGFAEIAAQYPEGFDLTMLEIGAFHPLWDSIHLGPDNAVRAFEAMGARGLLMPIHWGLFNLALHAWNQPVERVLELAAEKGTPLWLPKPGEPTEVVAGEPLNSLWWR